MPTPGKYTKNQDTFHEAEDSNTTGYIKTDDDGLGDPVPLIGGFGGKINQIIQILWDNINYLKKRFDNFSSGPEKATQSEVNAGTDTDKYITPDTLDGYKKVASASITNSAINASNYTILSNIIIGKTLYLSLKFTSDSTNNNASTWTLSGGAWNIALLSAINTSSSNTFGRPHNIVKNTNNTTFQIGHHFWGDTNDILFIIAVLD